MRFTFISSLSVGHVIFLAVSLTLYMKSARSWHRYSSFPTAVLYTARFSFPSSTSDSVVGVLFTLGVDTGLESSRPSTAITSRRCTSDLPQPSIHEPFSQSLCRERRFCHQFLHSSHDPHQDLIRKKLNLPQNFDSQAKQQIVINVNENIDVQLTIFETTRICQKWMVIQTFQETYKILMPHFGAV